MECISAHSLRKPTYIQIIHQHRTSFWYFPVVEKTKLRKETHILDSLILFQNFIIYKFENFWHLNIIWLYITSFVFRDLSVFLYINKYQLQVDKDTNAKGKNFNKNKLWEDYVEEYL